jgi:hypothetical protein
MSCQRSAMPAWRASCARQRVCLGHGCWGVAGIRNTPLLTGF